MKNLYAICFFLLFLPTVILLNAQQKTAGIYILNIGMSDALTEEFVDVNRHTSKQGYSISTILPDSLIKSIKSVTEEFIGKKLNSEAKCIYKISKNGEQVSTVGWGNVEGMPTNTFKGALATEKLDYYIKIDVLVQTGGKAIFFGKGLWSKLKPRVSADIKIVDDLKNEVYTKKILIKDFSDLRSVTNNQEVNSGFSPEYLSPDDLYMMYKLTLMRLLNEN